MRYPSNLRLQFELSKLYQNSGAPTLSYRVAQKFTWRIGESQRGSIPLAVYELMFPRHFDSLIVTHAQKNRLEPWLLSAIIRQESIFNPRIVSPAGAIGLMQIMPATGQTLADTLREPFTADSLYNPANNVRLGALYVRELLDQFEGNIVLALASYNGGPHNAVKWYAINRDDEFDLFVEDLAFSETRGYVKKVLANYWTYSQLQRSAW
jgi:soluble lytic murein transglycosylase